MYKVPNKKIANTFNALKIYKFEIETEKQKEEKKDDKKDDDNDEWDDDDNEEWGDDDNEKTEIAVDIEKIRRFLLEYEILNNLNHPNIINTYSFYFGNKKIHLQFYLNIVVII